MNAAPLVSLPLLSLLIAVPLLGALLMLVWPGEPSPNRLRGGAIVSLVLQLLVSGLVLLLFDPDQAGLQLRERQAWLPGWCCCCSIPTRPVCSCGSARPGCRASA